MGANSCEVSFSLISVGVHPSVNYVSFDFLHKVSYYVLVAFLLCVVRQKGEFCCI
jgi:hypothetical protein